LRQINGHVPIPDLAFFIDVDPRVSLERIINRDGGATKKEETDLLIMARTRDNFINRVWGFDSHYYVIDGNRAEAPIAAEVYDRLAGFLNGDFKHCSSKAAG
jgi:dTMP kinase